MEIFTPMRVLQTALSDASNSTNHWNRSPWSVMTSLRTALFVSMKIRIQRSLRRMPQVPDWVVVPLSYFSRDQTMNGESTVHS